MKVAVIGAGVLGGATVLALQRLGAEVLVVEQDRAGSGTSSRGAGLVSEGMWHPTSLRLVTRSIELLQRLSKDGEERGHPFRFHQTGSTTLLPPQLVAGARALAQMQAREGAQVRELAPEDLAALPHHAGMRVDDVSHAIHYPRDGWAMPRMYAEIATIGSQMMGAEVVKGDARISREPLGVVIDGALHKADAIVVAGGVWTRRVLRTADLDAPILAYRTQALRYANAQADQVPIVHDAVQGFYLRPGAQNDLTAGNGTTTTPEDIDRWKMDADQAFVDMTLRRLQHRFPYLTKDARIDAWAGIDAATPDRLLLAGPLAADPRIHVLAGGNGHGFMRAPAAGEAVAALVMGKRPRIDISAFSPTRFSDAPATFPIREGYSLESPALK